MKESKHTVQKIVLTGKFNLWNRAKALVNSSLQGNFGKELYAILGNVTSVFIK